MQKTRRTTPALNTSLSASSAVEYPVKSGMNEDFSAPAPQIELETHPDASRRSHSIAGNVEPNVNGERSGEEEDSQKTCEVASEEAGEGSNQRESGSNGEKFYNDFVDKPKVKRTSTSSPAPDSKGEPTFDLSRFFNELRNKATHPLQTPRPRTPSTVRGTALSKATQDFIKTTGGPALHATHTCPHLVDDMWPSFHPPDESLPPPPPAPPSKCDCSICVRAKSKNKTGPDLDTEPRSEGCSEARVPVWFQRVQDATTTTTMRDGRAILPLYGPGVPPLALEFKSVPPLVPVPAASPALSRPSAASGGSSTSHDRS